MNVLPILTRCVEIAKSLFAVRSRYAPRGNLRRRTKLTGVVLEAAQVLEERVLLSTITVTSAADVAGAHSGVTLRDAINQANARSGADTIVFAASLNGSSIKLTQGQLKITDSLTIQGNGASNTIVDGQKLSRVFDITTTAAAVTFDSLTITGGKTTAMNEGGGGIRFLSTGALKIQNSAITGNSTTGAGGTGGGITSGLGTVTITSSTLSGNTTSGQSGSGGAIYAIGGSISLVNSTITGNSTAGMAAFGGGIASPTGSLSLVSTTLARNATKGSSASGGGIYTRVGKVTLSSSIVAQNTVVSGGYPDIFSNFPLGATVTADHSIVGNRVGTLLTYAPLGSPDAKGNLVGTTGFLIDPKLGALAKNGGQTQTMALLAGSPALNTGGTTTLKFDQRGNPSARVLGGKVDIGAFEGTATPVATPATPATPATALPSVKLTLGSTTLAEAAGKTTVTATLSAVSSSPVTVALAFTGTAKTADYTRSATTITIPAGKLSASITLTALQDTLYEGNETVIVDIASVTNGTEDGTQKVTATIVEDDPAPKVTLSLSPASVSEAGGKTTLTATLSAAAAVPTTVSLSFTGTATLTSDYTRSATSITIPAGKLSASISLTAVQDKVSEGSETIIVDITSVKNGVENGVQKVTAKIVDDEASSASLQLLSSTTAIDGAFAETSA